MIINNLNFYYKTNSFYSFRFKGIESEAPVQNPECNDEKYQKWLERALLKKAQKALAEQRRIELAIKNAPINTIDEENKTIDIFAKGVYPANVLSNFNREEIPFYVDGVPCHSIEGFLQGIKQPDEEIQREFCLKSGATARHLGQKFSKAWKKDQTLYWQGKEYKRDSEEYQELVRKVFNARFEHSERYRNALKDTKGYTLTHTIGCNDPTMTVLTEQEFLSIINELRDKLED